MSAGAYEMKGPSAFAGGSGRMLQLTRILAVTEFKLRFFDSFLGYFWSVLRPLLFFGVLFVVFNEFVKLGGGTKDYPLLLLNGIVLFSFFQEATTRAVTTVVDHESLVRKVQFPRIAIPLSTVLTAGFNLVLSLAVLVVFVLASGHTPTLSWLELPLAAAALVALACGAATLLSALYVFARDVQPIWEVGVQALFYATPILYPIERVAEHSQTAAHLLMCNPIAVVVQQSRHALIDPTAPSAAAAIGGALYLVIPTAIALTGCLLGFLVFNRTAPRIAEEL